MSFFFLQITDASKTAAGCVSSINVKWKFVMFIAVWVRFPLIYLTVDFRASCLVSFNPLGTDARLQKRQWSRSESVVRG